MWRAVTRTSSLGARATYRRDCAPLRARLIVGADADYSPGSFTADGISGEFFLPSPSEKDTIDATVQVLDGGNIAVDLRYRAQFFFSIGGAGRFGEPKNSHGPSVALAYTF